MFHIRYGLGLQELCTIIFIIDVLQMSELRHQEAKKTVYGYVFQLSSCIMFTDPNSSLSTDPKEVFAGTKSNEILLLPLRVF